MRLLLILLILLAFPALELTLLIQLAARFGWWVLAYLVLSVVCGWMLIMEERIVVFGRLIQTLQEGGHPILALLASARKVIAGFLLIFPGVVSDILAILLLVMPIPAPRKRPPDDHVIEGEWRREE